MKTSNRGAYTNRRFEALIKVMFYNERSTLKRLAITGDSHAKDFVNMVVENNKLTKYQIRTHRILAAFQMYIGEENRFSLLSDGNRAECKNADELRYAKSLIEESDVLFLLLTGIGGQHNASIRLLPTCV